MTDTTTELEPEQDEKYLKSTPMTRSIAHLAVPMMFAMAAGTIYNVINAYFLGTLHSTPILAALTYALPLMVLAFAVGGVFGAGGSSYVGRLMGADDREKIKGAAAFTLYGSFFTGVIISVLVLLFLHPIIIGLGTAASAVAPTTQYAFMLTLWGPVFIATMAAEQLVRATGAAKQSMIGLLYSTVANLIFDVLFILILHMGVTGAALAIGLSNLIGLAYYLWFLHKKRQAISLNIKYFKITKVLIKEVLGVGSSELIQTAFLLVTTIILNHVATQYGPALLAAFGVANRIVQLPEALSMGIYIGMLPLFSYTFGAKDFHRLRQGFLHSLAWIGGMVIIFGGIVFLLRDQVIHLFSNDPQLITYGAIFLVAMLVSTLFNGFTGLMMAYFQGTAKAKSAAVLGFAMGGWFIPAIIFGSLWFGSTGVIWALPASEILSFITAIILFVAFPHQQAPTALEPNVDQEIDAARIAGEVGI